MRVAVLLTTILLGFAWAVPASADVTGPPERPNWDEEPPPKRVAAMMLAGAGLALGLFAMRARRRSRLSR